MLIASIVIFPLALYCTIVIIANLVTNACRFMVLGGRPKDERPKGVSIAMVDPVHAVVTVVLWTAFYAVRVLS